MVVIGAGIKTDELKSIADHAGVKCSTVNASNAIDIDFLDIATSSKFIKAVHDIGYRISTSFSSAVVSRDE